MAWQSLQKVCPQAMDVASLAATSKKQLWHQVMTISSAEGND